MKLLNLILTLLFTHTIFQADAQPLNVQWDARFGGDDYDGMTAHLRTSDGGYIFGGTSSSGISGDKSQASRGDNDMWVVKTNSTGDKSWDKTFGGSLNDGLQAILETSDGGYLLAGSSSSGISGDKSQASRGSSDYWVVKINNLGVKQWDATFGGSGDDYITSIAYTNDGGYILGGTSNSPVSGDKTQGSQGQEDFWAVKITSSGSKVWDYRFGGSGGDRLYSLIAVSDGGFLLGGESSSPISGDKTQGSRGATDFWIVKLNVSGIKQWDSRFGGDMLDWIHSMVETDDSGFLLGGPSLSVNTGDKSDPNIGSTDFWVVKTNNIGVKQWDRAFGGTSQDELKSMVKLSDGSFALFGSSNSGISGTKTKDTKGGLDYWLVKITSTGSYEWDEVYGGDDQDYPGGLSLASGGYTLSGYTWTLQNGDISEPSRGSTDYWIVNVGSSPTLQLTTSFPQPMCGGSQGDVFYSSSAVFLGGNTFSIQLSDMAGSFASPTIIGTLSSTDNSGSVGYTIPNSITTGNGYRVRLVSSNPPLISDDNGINLELLNAPIPVITVNGTQLTSTPGMEYVWTLNADPIPGADGQTYTYTQDGDYQVQVLYANGCVALSAVKTISSTTPPANACDSNATYSFVLVKDIISSWSSSSPKCLYKVADNKVFFIAKDPVTNTDGLYVTDGTSNGTVMIKAGLLPVTYDPYYSSQFCTFQGKYCFVGKQSNGNNQIYISDGTVAGTYAITNFAASYNINQLTVFNGKLYFKVYGGGTGGLYHSNGTAASATNFYTLVFNDWQSTLHVDNNQLYLVTASKLFNITNNSSPVQIYDHYVNYNGCISSRETVNGKLIYQDNRNCTSAGPEYQDVVEVDLQTGASRVLSSSIVFSNPVDYFRAAAVFKNAVYFYYNPTVANEINDLAYIYKYDGSNLTVLHTHSQDSANLNFYGFVQNANRLVYTIEVDLDNVNANPGGWAILSETDGTPSGYKKIFDKTSSAIFRSSTSINEIVVMNDRIYFEADTFPTVFSTNPKSRLWYYDGTGSYRVMPNSDRKYFNTTERIALNNETLLLSALMKTNVGFDEGSEPWVYKCTATTGIKEEKNNPVSIYPNPSGGLFYLNAELPIDKIAVYDHSGKLVMMSTNNVRSLDLSQFSNGMYVIEIFTGNSVMREKVILAK